MQGDVELATWALERDDTELKIPYMNMAKEVRKRFRKVKDFFKDQKHIKNCQECENI